MWRVWKLDDASLGTALHIQLRQRAQSCYFWSRFWRSYFLSREKQHFWSLMTSIHDVYASQTMQVRRPPNLSSSACKPKVLIFEVGCAIAILVSRKTEFFIADDADSWRVWKLDDASLGTALNASYATGPKVFIFGVYFGKAIIILVKNSLSDGWWRKHFHRST